MRLRWREQPRLRPGYGSRLLLTLIGEPLDGESEGGMIRDRELVLRVEEVEYQLTGCLTGWAIGAGTRDQGRSFPQASPVRRQEFVSVYETLA
jgi:hypothetical protein